MMLRTILILLITYPFIGFSQTATPSGTEEEPEKIKVFNSNYIINSTSVETQRRHLLEFLVFHRFDDLVGARGGPRTLFGLDNMRDVRIGFEYGVTDHFTIGIGRNKGDRGAFPVQEVSEIFDAMVKYRLLWQDEQNTTPLSLTLFANTAYTAMMRRTTPGSEANFENQGERFSYSTQLLAAKRFSDKLAVQLMPTYVRRNWAVHPDEQDLFALGASGKIMVSRVFGIIGEYFHVFSEPRQQNTDIYSNPLGIGVEFNVPGHIFHVNFTNSTGVIPNTYVPYTTGNWLDGEFRFGFMISRQFRMVKQ